MAIASTMSIEKPRSAAMISETSLVSTFQFSTSGHALLEGGRIVTDARNAAVHDMAMTQVIYRRAVVDAMPPALLLN